MEKITDMALLKECLLKMLTEGIQMENGEYRRADVIDYFLITNILPRDLFNAFKAAGIRINREEKNILLRIVRKYSITSLEIPEDLFMKKVFGEKIIINNELVTDDLKNATITYMRENEIPLAYVNYSLCLKRVIADREKQAEIGL